MDLAFLVDRPLAKFKNHRNVLRNADIDFRIALSSRAMITDVDIVSFVSKEDM